MEGKNGGQLYPSVTSAITEVEIGLTLCRIICMLVTTREKINTTEVISDSHTGSRIGYGDRYNKYLIILICLSRSRTEPLRRGFLHQNQLPSFVITHVLSFHFSTYFCLALYSRTTSTEHSTAAPATCILYFQSDSLLMNLFVLMIFLQSILFP